MEKVKIVRWLLISLCALTIVIFTALIALNSSYLSWDYKNPELAVAGTIMHGFEFVFVRLAPVVFLVSVIGIVMTYRKK